MKKKILVVYARYGSGHKSIAEYVSNYISEHNDYEVKLLDITPYGNFMGRVGIKLFDYVTRHRSAKLFNFCYELMDNKLSTLSHNLVAQKSYNNKRLKKDISDFNPDVTISSHFYGSNIITYYNSKGITNSKVFTIITDYRAHECWTRNNKVEDGYIVGNEIVKEELIKRGVSSKKIYPFGLPLNISEINKLDSREEILKRYNLKGDKDIYLFFGGSTAGSMYYFDYFKAITKLNINKDIIFISGKHEKLKEKCEEYVLKNNIKNVVVLGFTNDVFNLMKISSLVISKPGGATVTECLEMHKPMILIPGLGGQEKYNARFIAKKKYGVKINTLWGFKRYIKFLERNFSVVDKMKDRLDKQDKNMSVEKINDLIRRS